MLKAVKSVPLDKGQVPLVPLDHILVEEGFNVRSAKNAEPDEELIASVKFRGVLSPIHIREDKEGNFLLIDGHRRYQAAKLSGNTKAVPAINHGPISDQEALILALTLTGNHKSFSKKEMMTACRRLRDSGMTVEAIGKALGKSKSTISVYLSVEKAAPKLQKAAADGEVPIKAAAKAAKLPKGEQPKVAEKMKGKTGRQANEVVEEAKQQAPAGRPGIKTAPQSAPTAPKGFGMRQPGEAAPPPEYKVVADYKERIKRMEEEVKKRRMRTPSNQILRGMDIVIAVLKGKMTVDQAFINWETI